MSLPGRVIPGYASLPSLLHRDRLASRRLTSPSCLLYKSSSNLDEIKMRTSLLRHFPIETDKKAANLLRVRPTGKQKDYGIMALLVPHKSTLRDLFRFLLVFRFPALFICFLFFRFFFWKNAFRAGG